MKSASVQKIAGALNSLVLITFVCNLLALPLVPTLVMLGGTEPLAAMAGSGLPDLPLWILAIFLIAWKQVWTAGSYSIMLTLFLLFSGICTAVIFWQAHRVLRTVLRGQPFSSENAASLKRAAGCAFLISGAALVRLVFSVFFYCSPRPLLTYNALFSPVFAIAGLLCLVMAALFHQAAELKAENDLTI